MIVGPFCQGMYWRFIHCVNLQGIEPAPGSRALHCPARGCRRQEAPHTPWQPSNPSPGRRGAPRGVSSERAHSNYSGLYIGLHIRRRRDMPSPIQFVFPVGRFLLKNNKKLYSSDSAAIRSVGRARTRLGGLSRTRSTGSIEARRSTKS